MLYQILDCGAFKDGRKRLFYVHLVSPGVVAAMDIVLTHLRDNNEKAYVMMWDDLKNLFYDLGATNQKPEDMKISKEPISFVATFNRFFTSIDPLLKHICLETNFNFIFGPTHISIPGGKGWYSKLPLVKKKDCTPVLNSLLMAPSPRHLLDPNRQLPVSEPFAGYIEADFSEVTSGKLSDFNMKTMACVWQNNNWEYYASDEKKFKTDEGGKCGYSPTFLATLQKEREDIEASEKSQKEIGQAKVPVLFPFI